MSHLVAAIIFEPAERFEPKVVPPDEGEAGFSVMVHHGERELVLLRLSKGQLAALYAALGAALTGTPGDGVAANGAMSQQPLL